MKKPVSKRSRKRDQYTVVLESMRDDVRLVLDAVQPIPKIQEKLDATFDEVGNLRVETDAVKAALKILGRDVQSLKQDVGTLKQDVGTLKQDVGTLKQDVGTLKQDVNVLKKDMSAVKQDVSGLKEDMHIVKGDLRTIKNDLKAKVDREEFVALEERVERLEEVTRAR